MATKNVEEQLLAVIDKNLPAMAAKQMKEYIEEMEQLKEDYNDLLEAQERLKKEIEEVKKEKMEVLLRNTKLEEHDAEVSKKEIYWAEVEKSTKELQATIDLRIANNENILLNKQRQEFMELVSLIFRNPITKRTVIEGISENEPTMNNGYPSGTMINKNKSKNTTETITEE